MKKVLLDEKWCSIYPFMRPSEFIAVNNIMNLYEYHLRKGDKKSDEAFAYKLGSLRQFSVYVCEEIEALNTLRESGLLDYMKVNDTNVLVKVNEEKYYKILGMQKR